MNPIKKAWRRLRQQDRVDVLIEIIIARECTIDQLSNKIDQLSDQLNWLQCRRSQASRKGWQTRRDNAKQAAKDRDHQNERAMIKAGLCQTPKSITARTRDGERNNDKPSDGVKHNRTTKGAK